MDSEFNGVDKWQDSVRKAASRLRVGAAEVPLPYAKNLEQAALPSDAKIVEAANAVLAG